MSMKILITLLCAMFVSIAAVAGVYENKVAQEVDYSLLPDDDKMLGFLWKDFSIKYTEKGKISGIDENTVDVYVNYLRSKIDQPTKTEYIKTVRGVGYMMVN